MKPLFETFEYQSPQSLAACFEGDCQVVLLESSRQMPGFGEHSYLGIAPFKTVMSKGSQVIIDGKRHELNSVVDVLEKLCAHYAFECLDDGIAFQGGLMGYLGYEAGQYFEHLPAVSDPINLPELYFGFFDLVVAFDHQNEKCTVYSSGLPKQGKEARVHQANERLGWFFSKLQTEQRPNSIAEPVVTCCQSNFTAESYCDAVRKAKEYIAAGDIFEVNLSQQWTVEFATRPECFHLYQQLQTTNAAPFSAYINFPQGAVISCSPERYLRAQGSRLSVSPIKGTIARATDEQQDKQLAQTLKTSEKDRAENIMIVDLMRNDLSRVCEDDSVTVTELLGMKSFANVHHLVSTIEGTLRAGESVFSALKASYPAGSITGAPKIRAQQIISELEQTTRGPYCGSMGYVGFNGDADFSVAIRTMAVNDTKGYFSAGGAVVLDSCPEQEYQETLTKAAPFLALFAKESSA